jgi:predicted AAA+ superfamily ATPase
MVLNRNTVEHVRELLAGFRLVVLGGARQTGKTTLVRELLGLPDQARYSFDDESLLRRATDDPVGFVEALPRPAAVDEFQRAGRGFLLAVKQAADLDPARPAPTYRLGKLSGRPDDLRNTGRPRRAPGAVAAVGR